jgi:MFS family permease
MPTPSPEQRAALDQYVQQLAYLADGLTLDDFRTRQVLRAARTATRVRIYILVVSFLFLGLAIFALFFAQFADAATLVAERQNQKKYDLWLAATWALALGGLGAVASIFLHVLKLLPQQTLRTSDEFEVVGRIILGCLFSTILATTLGVSQLAKFFGQLKEGDLPDGSAILLLPFLAGYSITLVLNLLDKAIRAVELTIGLEDRRSVNPADRTGMTKRGRGQR